MSINNRSSRRLTRAQSSVLRSASSCKALVEEEEEEDDDGKKKETMRSNGSLFYPSFKPGDLVWVRLGAKHEETGTVVQISCPCPIEDHSDDDDDDRDISQPATTANDGILVKLTVSNHKEVYPARKIRKVDDRDGSTMSTLRSRNRSQDQSRTRAAPKKQKRPNNSEVPVSKEGPTPAPPASATARQRPRQRRRSAVTPSPTMAASDHHLQLAMAYENRADEDDDHDCEDNDMSVNSKDIKNTSNQNVLDKKPAAKRKSRTIEPSDKSRASRNISIKEDSNFLANTDSDDDDEPLGSLKRARSNQVASPLLLSSASSSVDSQNDTLTGASLFCCPVASPPAEKKKLVPINRVKLLDASDSTQARSKKAQLACKKIQLIVASDDSDNSNGNINNDIDNDDDDDDDDDHLERPFEVEYAPSSRSMCRRCDSVIDKGTVRISHTPLFRGKPGYRVYRHLSCAIFDDTIHQAEQIGGWRKLDRDDYEALALRVEESKLEVEMEQQELEPDELVQTAFQGEMRAPPLGLTASLLPFQVEGVSWMYHQEVHVSNIRGGILADEMGMGKTLQAFVTILDNRPKLQHTTPGVKHPPSAPDLHQRMREEGLWEKATKEWHYEMDMNNVPKKLRPKKCGAARAGTLVICPVIALSQWKSEIEKFSEAGTVSVCVYHGPNRTSEMPVEVLRTYDIVLTTYQVLEADFRKMMSPNKVTCPNCGAKFKIDKLSIHLRYFCGDGAQRTEAQMRQHRRADREGDPSAASRQRGGGGGGGGRRSGGGKKEGRSSKKSFSGNSQTPLRTTKTKGAQSKRNTRGIPLTSGNSDSEISWGNDAGMESLRNGGQRPSRSAAVTASKRIKSYREPETRTEAGGSKRVRKSSSESEESNYSDALSEPEDDDDDESAMESNDSPISSLKALARKSAGSKNMAAAVKKQRRGESETDSLERAREKQRQAMEQARESRNKKLVKKNAAATGKKGKGSKGKAQGKRKKFDEEPLDPSDGDDEDDNSDDPMQGIDMDRLMDEAMSGARCSVLHSFCWWRVILDEAHMIKSRSSQTAAAAFSLTSIHRWALSGTPLQNRVGELYSLIRFLRLDPMAHYICRQKECTCKGIHYRMRNGVCLDCGHRGFLHYSHFNRYVLNPIQRDGYSGDGRRAMFKLKHDVLDECLLRRTKESRAEDMNLPPRLVTIRPIRLHPVEEDFYNALYTQTKSSFDDYVAEGTLLNNYAHIFDLLTKMRQAVNHPYLIVYSKTNMQRRANNGGQQRQQALVANGSTDCEICHEPPTDRIVTTCCGAGVCRACVIEYLTGAGGDNTPCPSCRAPFTIDLNQAPIDVSPYDSALALPISDHSFSGSIPSLKELPHVATGSILRRINLAEFATSSKVEVLIQELIDMRTKRPGSKALVFSQFVNMLDLVRWRLHSDPCLADMGLGVRILHGGMDAKSRDAALKDFREDGTIRVLLMSMKAAGVALNLTVASECFLLDLWWNPSAEMQCIDRTHRLGQHRPIRAVRFVAEGTVEERVLQLQEKKRLVFDGTVGRDAGSLKMLTVDDMKSLFA